MGKGAEVVATLTEVDTHRMLFSTRVRDEVQPQQPRRVELAEASSRIKQTKSFARPSTALGELRIELPAAKTQYAMSAETSKQIYTGGNLEGAQPTWAPKELALTPAEFRKWLSQYSEGEQELIRSSLASERARQQFRTGSVCKIKIRRRVAPPPPQ